MEVFFLLRPNQQSFQELENFEKKLFTFQKVLFESAEKERESRKEMRESERGKKMESEESEREREGLNDAQVVPTWMIFSRGRASHLRS